MINNATKTKRTTRTVLLELEPDISIPKNTINKNLHYDVAHIQLTLIYDAECFCS